MSDKSVTFLTEFVDIYRQHPSLWKIKSKCYVNKFLKDEAYDKLLRHFKSIDESATIDTVKKKINNLRCAFRKELKKVKKSQKSGSSADEIYIPTLWYYNLLLFTADQEEMRETRGDDEAYNNEENEIFETTTVENEIEIANSPDSDCSILPLATQYSANTSSGSNSRNSHTRESKKQKTSQQIAIEKACKILEEPKDEFDVIGENVAFKLRRMDSDQMLIAEQLINSVLFNGITKKLTDSSTIQLNPSSFMEQYNSVQPQPTINYIDATSRPLTNTECENDFALSNFITFGKN